MHIIKKSALTTLTLSLLTLPFGALAQSGLEQLSEVSTAKASKLSLSSKEKQGLNDILAKSLLGKNCKLLPLETPYTTLSNQFLGANKVLSLDGKNQLHMAAKDSTNSNDHQKWDLVKTNNGHYKFHNRALGTSLAVDSGTQKPHIAKTGNYSGQFWHFAPVGDWLKVSNMYQGKEKVLDTYNGAGNYVFLESKAKNTSGTYWKLNTVTPPQMQKCASDQKPKIWLVK